MPDITEFAADPPTATIKVGGKDMQVRGLSGRAFARLAREYPMLAELMNGRVDEGNTDVYLTILEIAPAIVAAAVRKPEDEDAIGDQLSISEAVPAILKIIELTTPPQQRGPLEESGGGAPLTEGSATK